MISISTLLHRLQLHGKSVCRATAEYLLVAGLIAWFAAGTGSAHAQIAIPASGNINTLAGNGTAGYVGSEDGGPSTSAELSDPAGIAVDVNGNIYIADAGNNRIRKITAATGLITTVAGNGTAGYVESEDGGPATSAELNGPTGVAVDMNGNIYIADAGNNRIRMVAAGTGLITTVAGNGTECSKPTASPACGDGGSPTSAELNDPFGVAVDASGNIYIADTNDLRVRKVTFPLNATPVINTIAGDGSGGYNGDNRTAISATIDHPIGVAVDASGNVYITDKFNQEIRVVYFSGTVINVSNPTVLDIYEVAGDPGGCGTSCYNGNDRAAVGADLHYPYSIAVDPIGNIYFGDLFNSCVRMIAASAFNGFTAGDIYDYAGQCTVAGFSGDNGAATSAELNFAWGVALDLSGNVYIGDSANNRVRVVGSQFATNTYTPLYKITSILYAPPGNLSSQGYGSFTTNATTTTIGSSFTSNKQITYTAGPPSILQGSETLGASTTSSQTDAFSQTYTDALTVTADDMSSTIWNPNKLDNLNHNLDTFEIWLNPLVTVMSTTATPAVPLFYSITSPTVTINGKAGPYADIIGVPASGMEAAPMGVTQLNPSGLANVTTVPLDSLIPQAIGDPVVYLPGLGAICKNNEPYKAQLQSPSSNSCTQANQCGCTPADFAGILQLDPLLNYNSSTNTAALYPATEDPLLLDSESLPGSTTPGSGSSVCGANGSAPPSTANCRYVIPPVSSLPLSDANQNGFMEQDSSGTTETLAGSTSNSVGIGSSFGPLKSMETWTWTDSESVGNSTTEGNQMFLTLKTGSACSENVNIFEDTLYHSYVFSLPAPNTACQPPTFSVALFPNISSNPNAISLGHSISYTVDVSALNGFTGAVALTISGLPAGVTANFSPSSINTSGSATLTLTAAYSTSTYIGTSTVTVTGTSGGVALPATFPLITRPLQYVGTCGVQ